MGNNDPPLYFNLSQFHFFDTSYHLFLINHQIKSCANDRSFFVVEKMAQKICLHPYHFVLILHNYCHAMKSIIQLQHLHLFLKPLDILTNIKVETYVVVRMHILK